MRTCAFLLLLAAGCAFAQQPTVISTGPAPRGVAFAATRNELLVSSSANNQLSIYDLSDLSAAPRVVSTLNAPAAVAVDDVLGLAVVAEPLNGQVTIVNLATLATTVVPVESLPYSLDINTATHTAVVANTGSRTLSLINLQTKTVTRVIADVPAVTDNVQSLAVNSSTNVAVVASPQTGTVLLVDLSGNTAPVEVPVGASPTAVAVNPVTNTAAVCNVAGNSVTLINLGTRQTTELTSLSLASPQGIAIHVPTNTAVISSTAANEVVVVNLATQAVLTRFTSLSQPAAVAARSLEREAAVVLPANNGVALISLPAPGPFTVANAASYVTVLSPGALASGFGSNLASTTVKQETLPLPTVLGSTSVRIGGVDAPLLFVSPTQINFQVPYGLSGSQTVEVRVNGAVVATDKVTIAATSPAFFTLDSSSRGDAAAVNQDGSLVSADGCIANAKPAPIGSIVQLFLTGHGVLTPALTAGQAAPATPLSKTASTPVVTLGGVPLTVTGFDGAFSGAAPGFAGLWQINAKIPTGAPSGAKVPLVVTLGGQSSTSLATLAVNTTTISCPK